jgi:hypothetical protein
VSFGEEIAMCIVDAGRFFLFTEKTQGKKSGFFHDTPALHFFFDESKKLLTKSPYFGNCWTS